MRKKSFTTLVLISSIILTLSLFADNATETAGSKDLIISEKKRVQKINNDQKILSQVKPRIPSKTLRLKVSTNKLNYKIGEAVIISVTPSADAYITIINHGTSGGMHQLFPNKYNKNRFVKAHQTIRVPKRGATYDFIVTEPIGSDFIKVIASTDSGKILADTSLKPLMKGGVFQKINKPAGALSKDLTFNLNKKQHTGKSIAYNHKINISR
jgi:hypothetical protein